MADDLTIDQDLETGSHPQRTGICTLLSTRQRMALFNYQLYFAANDCRKNTDHRYFRCA